MAESDFDQRVAAVRRFNRFYTRQIGLLQESYLKSQFSLSQVRVLYELAHRERPTATELGRELGLDPGYLTRILHLFERRGLLKRTPSKADGRQSHLFLTARGQAAFAPLNTRSREEIGSMLRALRARDQIRLVDSMHAIEGVLGAQPEKRVPYLLRPHRPGDMGWVVSRHGALYAQEYGWDETFEALVAGIVEKVIQRYDPGEGGCWISGKDGGAARSAVFFQQTGTLGQ